MAAKLERGIGALPMASCRRSSVAQSIAALMSEDQQSGGSAPSPGVTRAQWVRSVVTDIEGFTASTQRVVSA